MHLVLSLPLELKQFEGSKDSLIPVLSDCWRIDAGLAEYSSLRNLFKIQIYRLHL